MSRQRFLSAIFILCAASVFSNSAHAADLYLRPIEVFKDHVKRGLFEKCLFDGSKNIALFESRVKNRVLSNSYLVDTTFLNELYVMRDFCFESLPAKSQARFKVKPFIYVSDSDYFLGRALVALQNNLGVIGQNSAFERYLREKITSKAKAHLAGLTVGGILNYLKFTMRLDECFDFYQKFPEDALTGSYCAFLSSSPDSESAKHALSRSRNVGDVNASLLEISQLVLSSVKPDTKILERIKKIDQSKPAFRAVMALEKLRYFGFQDKKAEVVRILNSFPVNQDGEAQLAQHGLVFLGTEYVYSAQWCGRVSEVYLRNKSDSVLARLVQQAIWVVRCGNHSSKSALQFAHRHLTQVTAIMPKESLLYMIAKNALESQRSAQTTLKMPSYSPQLKNFLKLYGVDSK